MISSGLAAALSILLSTQTGPLDLESSLRVAESNSFALKIADSNIEKARRRIDEIKGNLGPKVNAGATYTRFGEAQPSFGGGAANPIDTKSIDLTLSYPITFGVGSKAVNAGIYLLKAEQAQRDTALNELRYTVKQAYFRVLQAASQIKTAEEALARANERLEITKKEVAQGVRANVDVLRLETTVRQSEADLLTAKNAFNLAKSSFNNTLGRPIMTEVALAEMEAKPVENLSEETLQADALKNRPELKAIEFSISALAYTRESNEGGMVPSMNVSLQHTRNLGAIGSFSQRATTVGVVAVQIPIWDSGVTRAKVKQARQDEVQAKVNLEQVQLGISLEVKQGVLNVQNAGERLAVLEKQLTLARENYRLVTLRFDNGEGIALEVADASTQLTNAQIATYAARYDYLNAIAQLERAVGRSLQGGN